LAKTSALCNKTRLGLEAVLKEFAMEHGPITTVDGKKSCITTRMVEPPTKSKDVYHLSDIHWCRISQPSTVC
jgi:hypothetical protein